MNKILPQDYTEFFFEFATENKLKDFEMPACKIRLFVVAYNSRY